MFEGRDCVAQAPPDWFDAERSLAFAAGIVSRGLVRFCAPVADKMATQTIGAALAFKAGDTVEMALRTAFIQAIGLKYDQRLDKPAEIPGLSAILKRFRQFANALGDFVARALLAPRIRRSRFALNERHRVILTWITRLTSAHAFQAGKAKLEP